jgi:hypothetical protein
MTILRIAVLSGALIGVWLLIAHLLADAVRGDRRPARQVAEVAPPCTCQRCARATTGSAA